MNIEENICPSLDFDEEDLSLLLGRADQLALHVQDLSADLLQIHLLDLWIYILQRRASGKTMKNMYEKEKNFKKKE